MCIKLPEKKQKDPLTIHVIGEMSKCMTDQSQIEKYTNLGALVVTVIVNNTAIQNTLIDLGSTINMMTTAVLEVLQLGQSLRPTPSILELADRTTVKPTGVLDDIIVLVASWEYPVDFMVVESKDPSKGHPIILGRPWLATANYFIGCRDGEMTISYGLSTQRLILYHPTKPITENSWWLNFYFGDEYFDYLSLPSDFFLAFQEKTTENVLNQFVSSTTCMDFPQSFAQVDQIFEDEF